MRRPRVVVIALIAALVVLYVVVVVLYAVTSRPNALSGEVSATSDEAVVVTLRAQSVNAVGNRLGMTVDLTNRGPLDDNGTLSRPVSVVVTENDGPRVIDFASGTLTSAVSASLITNGFVELWPFDRYTVATTIAAGQGVGDDVEFVPTDVVLAGGAPGWALEAHEEWLGAEIIIDGVETAYPTIVITASRSGATIAFGILLLTLMVVMPVLVLTVAILVYTGRRKVEPSLMSWTAAMLFATIPLRTFLPGSPPVGSWIDFTVVLWVVFGLVAGLTIYVLAWRRWSPTLVAGEPAP